MGLGGWDVWDWMAASLGALFVVQRIVMVLIRDRIEIRGRGGSHALETDRLKRPEVTDR